MRQICEKEYTCAVLNLNEKRQTVYWYQAPGKATAPVGIEGPERTDRARDTVEISDDDGPDSRVSPLSPRSEIDCPEDAPDPVLSPAC